MGPDVLVPIAGMLTGVISVVAIGYAVVGVGRGPIGQALARRLAGRSGQQDPEVLQEVDALKHQVEHLEQRLLDAEERIDFSERLLAQRSEPEPRRVAP